MNIAKRKIHYLIPIKEFKDLLIKYGNYKLKCKLGCADFQLRD